jgi:hypothetical protein
MRPRLLRAGVAAGGAIFAGIKRCIRAGARISAVSGSGAAGSTSSRATCPRVGSARRPAVAAIGARPISSDRHASRLQRGQPEEQRREAAVAHGVVAPLHLSAMRATRFLLLDVTLTTEANGKHPTSLYDDVYLVKVAASSSD